MHFAAKSWVNEHGVSDAKGLPTEGNGIVEPLALDAQPTRLAQPLDLRARCRPPLWHLPSGGNRADRVESSIDPPTNASFKRFGPFGAVKRAGAARLWLPATRYSLPCLACCVCHSGRACSLVCADGVSQHSGTECPTLLHQEDWSFWSWQGPAGSAAWHPGMADAGIARGFRSLRY